MSPPDDHVSWRDELAAYTLGALEPYEAAALEGHLVACDRCQLELARLTSAIQRLPASVGQVEPPMGLRRRIMDAVEEQASAPASLRVPRTPSRFRRMPRPAVAAGLAATLALAFVAGFALRGGDEAARPTTVLAQALSAGGISAALVHDAGNWELQVERLPALAPGRVYEVWVQDAAGLKPSSLFVLSRDGRAQVPLQQPLSPGDKVLVTHEPAGGSARPTSKPLLQVQA
jgi:anti-sigma-K factor RskA